MKMLGCKDWNCIIFMFLTSFLNIHFVLEMVDYHYALMFRVHFYYFYLTYCLRGFKHCGTLCCDWKS